MIEWLWTYICGIDWNALGMTTCIFSVPLLLYISWRNNKVADIYINWIHEEHAWRDERIETVGRMPWRRASALPKQQAMVFHFWRPLQDYVDSVKPVADYYKETK